METIEQLRAMRDSARARIEALPDYKLMTKLTTLIEELEVVFGVAEAPAGAAEEAGEEEAAEEEAETAPEASDEPVEEPAEGPAGYPGRAPAYDEPVEQQEWEPFEIAEEMADVDAYVDVPEGQAQADIEETAAYDPAQEAEPEEATAADTDIAISQAMAELEADLGGADFEPAPPSRFRYGNSS